MRNYLVNVYYTTSLAKLIIDKDIKSLQHLSIPQKYLTGNNGDEK